MIEVRGQSKCLRLQCAIWLDVIHKGRCTCEEWLQSGRIQLSGSLKAPKRIRH